MDAGEELTAHNVLPHEDAALKESEHLGLGGVKTVNLALVESRDEYLAPFGLTCASMFFSARTSRQVLRGC